MHDRRRLATTRIGVIAIASVVALTLGCSAVVPPVSERFSATTHAWWTYQRAATYEHSQTEVSVPVRDGTPIGCTLGRPTTDGTPAPGRFPGLIVQFTPYVLMAPMFEREARFFTTRGYNTLVCTLRGVGRSGGTWQHAMSSQDGRDAHDLVEWLAAQPFSDGRIGQFGESYGGQTSYGAAVEQPPHLVAVAPMQPPGNLYFDVIYPGGIKATERGTIDNWPLISPLLSAGAIDADAEFAVARAHPTYDAYWQDRALTGRLDRIQVPVLTIGGWDDGFFRSGTLADVEGALDRTWAIYGQWPHLPMVAFDDPCLVCPVTPLPSGVLLAWFDHWLKQLPEAGAVIPPTPTFVSEEGPAGAGAGWQELSWNPAGDDHATFRLGADGDLDELDGADRPRQRSGWWPAPGRTVAFDEPAEPTEPGGSASFTTAPFEHDRVLVGHSQLSLRAALSAPDANLYAELVDVAPDGTEIVVNDGFLRASHRRSHTDPQPVPTGRFLDYDVDIRADHHRFVAGHRLRLRVSGGSAAALEPVEVRVTVTVATGRASTLTVPGLAAPVAPVGR